MAIYSGKKSDLYEFNRVYRPKDIVIEFNDDGSDESVRLKTGRMDLPATYDKMPYVNCESSNNRYVFTTQTASDRWLITHGLKGFPLIQLYSSNDTIMYLQTSPDEEGRSFPIATSNRTDHHINGEIHYIDEDTVEVTFSEPVVGYAICLGIKENGMIYRGSGSVWEIHHNLNGKPFTQVYDSSGFLVNAEIEHLDDNTTKISFFSGRDYEVVDDPDARYGYTTKLGEKRPIDVKGYAVLIVEPTKSYIHTQTEPSMEWEVRHNLNNFCLTQLLDPELYVHLAEIRQINRSLVKVSFSEPMTGKAVCVATSEQSTTNTLSNSASQAGGVLIVDQYDLPDVAEALTNTIYVLKQSGFAYCTNDNFQWIAVTPGPARVDGNQFKDEEGKETDGNFWKNKPWEDK